MRWATPPPQVLSCEGAPLHTTTDGPEWCGGQAVLDYPIPPRLARATPLSQQQQKLFPSKFGTLVLLSQRAGRGMFLMVHILRWSQWQQAVDALTLQVKVLHVHMIPVFSWTLSEKGRSTDPQGRPYTSVSLHKGVLTQVCPYTSVSLHKYVLTEGRLYTSVSLHKCVFTQDLCTDATGPILSTDLLCPNACQCLPVLRLRLPCLAFLLGVGIQRKGVRGHRSGKPHCHIGMS